MDTTTWGVRPTPVPIDVTTPREMPVPAPEDQVIRLTPLGKILRKLRIDLEISQSAMAREIGISASKLSKVELVDGWLPEPILTRAADAFGVGETARRELFKAAAFFAPTVTLRVAPENRALVHLLAEKLPALTDTQRSQMQDILQMPSVTDSPPPQLRHGILRASAQPAPEPTGIPDDGESCASPEEADIILANVSARIHLKDNGQGGFEYAEAPIPEQGQTPEPKLDDFAGSPPPGTPLPSSSEDRSKHLLALGSTAGVDGLL
ncbi:helix-turn-helix domain-containing protein [Thiomonas sp.]